MKKRYEKPMVYIESFEMSQHIATCTDVLKKNQAIREGCSTEWVDEDHSDDKLEQDFLLNLFYTSLGKDCITDGDEQYCYTESTGPITIFTS